MATRARKGTGGGRKGRKDKSKKNAVEDATLKRGKKDAEPHILDADGAKYAPLKDMPAEGIYSLISNASILKLDRVAKRQYLRGPIEIIFWSPATRKAKPRQLLLFSDVVLIVKTLPKGLLRKTEKMEARVHLTIRNEIKITANQTSPNAVLNPNTISDTFPLLIEAPTGQFTIWALREDEQGLIKAWLENLCSGKRIDNRGINE